MTGNECINWKASTLKTHAHSAHNKQSVITEAKTPLQFQMCLMRKKESHGHTLCIKLPIPKLTDVWSSTNKI